MDGTAIISTHKDIVLGTGDFGFQVWGLGIGDWDCRPSLGPSDASVLEAVLRTALGNREAGTEVV